VKDDDLPFYTHSYGVSTYLQKSESPFPNNHHEKLGSIWLSSYTVNVLPIIILKSLIPFG
jgi:hypothetical protein